ncbi:MAG: 2-phospho-L-lactate transferase [Nocardioidaceae bacterium]|nr:2-phospho-L-lactate transferase [Nocardioidaceae bacterium]
MRVCVLSGGIGGARFTEGLRSTLGPDDQITVVANTADDIWLFGLKICPDLDTVMYTLGGGIDDERRWGRAHETWNAKEELLAYGVQPDWFGLGDRDLATHLVRTQMLSAGYGLSDVTRALCRRWDTGVELLAMSDDRVETHVLVDDDESDSGQRAIHFQEYWVRLRASVPVRGVVVVGLESATAGPGVVDEIEQSDLVVVAPSNPIVSVGPIVGVAEIREALRRTTAPVVGVSPIVGGAAVRGMADQLLSGLGVEVSAAGVGRHYGARDRGGLLDAWLVDSGDEAEVATLREAGVEAHARPLLMSDDALTTALAADTLEVGLALRDRPRP